MLIKTIYNTLLKAYGNQNWWPVTLDNETIPEYHKNIKLTEKQKLEIAEIQKPRLTRKKAEIIKVVLE